MDQNKTIADVYSSMKRLISDSEVEFFMFESPYNRYTPAPPDGYVAIRSRKRRLFVKASTRCNPEKIQKLIEQKEYIEVAI